MMRTARWRQCCAVLLTLSLILCYPAFAGERDLPVWLWFMQFDGTPNAVRARFNSLAQDRADEGHFASWNAVPSVPDANGTGNDNFLFFDRDIALPMTAGPVSYRISGSMGDRSRVQNLRIDIAPSGAFGRDYLTGCDQLAQICAESLFDELDDRTERNLLLELLYDLRPFSFHDQAPLTPRLRQLRTVTDGNVLMMEWGVDGNNAMWFTATLGGAASDTDIAAAQLNNHCNRLLSQTSDECGALLSCLKQMTKQLEANEPDWPDLTAGAAQASESSFVIEQLRNELQAYEKAASYADQLGLELPILKTALTEADAALKSTSKPALVAALTDSLASAGRAHKLISIVRAR